jgi:RNA polymerase sigma-70 factor (ECF subfamily)
MPESPGSKFEGSGCVLTTDEEADFTSLVQRQSRFVFRVAYAVLLNAHDAEDAVQETFLKLYRNGGWQRLSNERAFLARVAWRIAVDRRPCTDRSTVSLDHETETMPSSDPPSPHPGPEQTLVAADEHARGSTR